MLYTNINAPQVERVSGSEVTHQVIAELPQGTSLIPNSDNTVGKKLFNIFLGGLGATSRHTHLTLRALMELISIYSMQSSAELLRNLLSFWCIKFILKPESTFFFFFCPVFLSDGAVVLHCSEADIYRWLQRLSGGAGCGCAHPVALQVSLEPVLCLLFLKRRLIKAPYCTH